MTTPSSLDSVHFIESDDTMGDLADTNKEENERTYRKMSADDLYHETCQTARDNDNNNNSSAGEDLASRVYHTRKARRGSCFRRFSVELSTEQHFQIDADQDPIFVGAFGTIRKQYLDHNTFHSHYRKERQWLHDSIIEDVLENDVAVVEPEKDSQQQHPQWLILTCGVQGSGKHHAVRTLREQHTSLLDTYCCVDSDEIRHLLPEYAYYLDHSPELVDTLTQKEAGYIAETLSWAALQAGQSVLWDGSLRYPQWFVQHIQTLREVFPRLKVGLVHITAPSVQVILDRRAKKEQTPTGRHLYPDEPEYLEGEMSRIQKAVEVVRPSVDFVVTICNTPNSGLQFVDEERETFCSAFCEAQNTALPRLVSSNDSIMSMEETNTSVDDINFPPKRGNRHSSASSSCPLITCCQRRGTTRRCFSVCKSTEENHSSPNRKFYGRFADIRSTLDYTYHKNYTFERQRFQDAVLQDYLQGAVITDKDGIVCTTPTEPWIVFTAGAMGAGKSYTMRQLVQRGRFPLVAFVNVDPDDLRRRLPEYHLYVDHAPQLAGELTRKEAGFLAEILTLAALRAGKNVLVDGSLRDAVWYQQYFGRLRDEFPILRLAILQVTAPKETILARAASRAEQTGRVVPEVLLLQAFEQVPKSVAILESFVDYHATINNPPNTPDIELVTEGETWALFTSQWIQTCAWIPRTKKLKDNLKKQKELKRMESSS